jgi:hypothetical protein
MKNTILGGLLGGVVLFVWGAVSHTVLPLGHVGVRSMPSADEPAMLASFRGTLKERALYVFPGMPQDRQPTAEEQRAWEQKYTSGYGIVVYDPSPGAFSFPRNLLTEFAANVAAALLAALVLSWMAASAGYGRRVLAAAAFGLVMGLDIDVSQWNWYSFPTPFMLTQLMDHAIGWTLAGLVLARFTRPAS